MGASPVLRPRIGIPYRTRKEELTPGSTHIHKYLDAVRNAGGEPVEVSLELSESELADLAETLDGVVLSGSPADLSPSLFLAEKHPMTAEADADREKTDFALLEHSLTKLKPALAICYGIQSLNVFLGGTLVQDIPAEVSTTVQHDQEKDSDPDTFHSVRIEPGSRLARMAAAEEVRVNSSHHQSILELGRDLRVVARASDGVIEGVEWTGGANWVMGVQWHPERMYNADALAQLLFRNLVAAARETRDSAPVSASGRSLSR